jgi:hypothetical protein
LRNQWIATELSVVIKSEVVDERRARRLNAEDGGGKRRKMERMMRMDVMVA